MIAFALTAKREDVLKAFNATTGTEKKDAGFIEAIQKVVADRVAQIPTEHDIIGLEVKARPISAENLGVEIFVHSRKE